jgi:hypothetical protein
LSPQNDEYALSWKHSVRLKYHVHQLFSPLLVYAILQGDGELFNCDCGSLPRLSSQVCHSPLVPLGPHEMGHLPSDNQRHKVIFAICLQGCFSTGSNAQQLPVGVGVQAIWHRTFHATQNPFAWCHAPAGVSETCDLFHTMFEDIRWDLGCQQLHGRSLEWTVVFEPQDPTMIQCSHNGHNGGWKTKTTWFELIISYFCFVFTHVSKLLK